MFLICNKNERNKFRVATLSCIRLYKTIHKIIKEPFRISKKQSFIYKQLDQINPTALGTWYNIGPLFKCFTYLEQIILDY